MNISANHKAIKAYYDKREELVQQGVTHEMAVRESFKQLLEDLARTQKWTLVVEQKVEGLQRVVRPDGTLRDANTLPRGYWEAKDTRDDLDVEIARKFARNYPKTNIIFEDTQRAVLFQNGQHEGEYTLDQPEQVATLFTRFLEYSQPNIEGFEQAVGRFKADVPELARGLLLRINKAHKSNKAFQAAFAAFYELCKTALNPNISTDAVNEMLIQHMLTERLMRRVFENSEFTQRNAIAAEVEKVIVALTSKNFSRKEFLGQLDYFYEAIEAAAGELTGFTERQTFINTIYERFFQGYAVKVADTHGIVYTPQPIVDFMCAAVQEVLRDEFGYGLTDEKVCIIDPATGTGNFIVNLLRRIHAENPAALPDVYANRLFANEVMLLPYYVASLNVEHAYYELTGEYAPFEGLCFVDTLDLAEGTQMKLAFMTEKNSERVERQKNAEITVIIGNPPYNVGQLNENDNNKNRKYKVIDERVNETYTKDSKATSKSKLNDAYVKFFRWAADRLQGRDGIVCYVSNNGFIDQIAFDGMRKHLLQDFTQIYHLDLHGNVRQNPKLSGTTHNVFGIQVGVGITVAVSSSKNRERNLFYQRVPEFWRKEEKLAYLIENVDLDGKHNSLNTVAWEELTPDSHNTWLVPEYSDEFASYFPVGSKETRSAKGSDGETIFKVFTPGVTTARDDVVYNFDRATVTLRVKQFVEDYNAEVDRYRRAGAKSKVDEFVKYDKIKWSETLKLNLQRGNYADFDEEQIRVSSYRPFSKQFLFYDPILNERRRDFPRIFPILASESENQVICFSGPGHDIFYCLITDHIAELKYSNSTNGGTQCFPFYVYDEDGSNRRENITDWALQQFRERYAAPLPMHGEGLGEGSENPHTISPLPASPKHGGGESSRFDSKYGGGVEGERVMHGGGEETPTRGKGWAVSHNNPELYRKIKPLARQLRGEMTPAEEHLWQRIRRKNLHNYKFRRQHPVDRFIVDFYCAEARLVIEVDGAIHDYTQEEDALRQAYLESLGLRVLRFTNGEVMQHTDAVVERIGEVLQEWENQPHDQPLPQPLPKHGEGSQELVVHGSQSFSSPMHGGGRVGEDQQGKGRVGEDQQGKGRVGEDQQGKGRVGEDQQQMRDISKEDIFYYVYGILHHPGYRERYADNLKRELPRIPFAPKFWRFAEIGRMLAELHLNYETVEPYPLERRWAKDKPVNWRVEKMRLSADKTMLKVNDSLTLAGIPPETFESRLGNRSALDWVIDQYRVKTDQRSGITSDPNGYSEDEQYIVKLVGQVISVSVETVNLVNGLAELPFREGDA